MRNPYVIAVLCLLVLAAIAFVWGYRDGSQAAVVQTPEQIFAEVSHQFGFAREDVSSFTIYGEDRVSYYLISNRAITFAYKDGGAWHIAGPDASQEAPLCSLLAGVPERFRQACYDQDTQQMRYTDAQGQNANYPLAGSISYIGQ